MTRPARRARRRITAGVLAIAGVVGCQFIVSSDLPEYTCGAAAPGACPTGLVCDVGAGRCVRETVPESGEPGTEGGPSKDAGRLDSADAEPELGATCVVDGDCKAGLLCGTSTVLTTATTTKPICTKPCCTSGDCPDGFVCYAPGTGGNYCVAAGIAHRDPPGAKTAGQPCNAGTECRSGLCTGNCGGDGSLRCERNADCDGSVCGGGRCTDTCCGATDCAPGTVCRLSEVQSHIVWSCGAPNGPGGKDVGQSCTTTTECKNDACVFTVVPNKRCTPPCCSAKDCAAAGFTNNVCAYGDNGNDRVKWCFVPNPQTGFCQGKDAGCTRASDCDSGLCVGAVGAGCDRGTDCISRYCDSELGTCAEACCTDEDCAPTHACRPSRVQTPFLRCVPKG